MLKLPEKGKTLVINDLHIPYVDTKALNLVYSFIKEFKPDNVIINGDFIDCFALSRFDKAPGRGKSFVEEIHMGKKILSHLRSILPKGKIIYICGNHEFRLKRYLLSNAPEMFDMEGISLPYLLDLKKYKVTWVDSDDDSSWQDTYVQVGNVFVGHYNRVTKHSAGTAKALVDDKGVSLIQAHCFSSDTEVLTREGWKYFPDTKIGEDVLTYNLENGNSEWNQIEALYNYNHFKKMVHFKSMVSDLLVTEDHALVCTSKKKPSTKFRRSEAKNWINRRVDMPNAGTNSNTDYPIEDDFLRLCAWVVTEGSYPGDSLGIRIAQSEKEKVGIKHITDICEKVGQSYKVNLRYKGGEIGHGTFKTYDAFRIHLHSSLNTKKIRELFPKKQLAWWLLNLSKRQFDLFFRELYLADGCKNSDATRSYQYCSKHEEEIDVLQALCALNGYRSLKRRRTNQWPGRYYYMLTINTRGVSSITEGGKLVDYEGDVYCASVKNQTLVVRRNGSVIVSGNTHRIGAYYKRKMTGEVLTGFENGCLCDLTPSYMKNPNWQHGMTTIVNGHMTLHHVENYSFSWNGKTFK